MAGRTCCARSRHHAATHIYLCTAWRLCILSWLQALEFQSQQRVLALQQDDLLAAGASKLRDAAAAQAGALAAQLQAKMVEWQAEDDARALKLQHELASKARLAAAAEQRAALQAAKGLLLAQELQAQQEVAQVERQRHLRQLAEDEAELTAQQLDAAAAAQASGAATAVVEVPTSPGQAARVAALVAAECEVVQQQLARLHGVAAARPCAPATKLSEVQQQAAAVQHAYKEQSGAVAALLAGLQLQHSMQPEAGKDPPSRPHQPEAAATQRLPRKKTTTQQQASHHEAGASHGSSAAAAGSPASAQPTPPSSSSGSGGVSPYSSSSLTSISADLEQLLAETEAQVQRDLAVARVHLTGSRQTATHLASLHTPAAANRGDAAYGGCRLPPVLEEPLACLGAAAAGGTCTGNTASDDGADGGGSPASASSSKQPSSLSFDLPSGQHAAASVASSTATPDCASIPTPMRGGSRSRARTGTPAVVQADDEPDEQDTELLRRSSSATSEELEDLLQQLSAYEQHLLAGSTSVSTGQRVAGSRAANSLAGSVSWSQTLATLPEDLKPSSSCLSSAAGSIR